MDEPPTGPIPPTIENCDDLDSGIAAYIDRGYRLDMIVPADSPTAAEVSLGGHSVRLVRHAVESPRLRGTDNWITGRAGMEYRDLISDRLGGRLIASHIRLTKGGAVADYVHYHKVGFQMIYCAAGAIKVVYEDQGPPFWLLPGDCVLQPPEIRHRVLEAVAGSEVIELGLPAVHETWVEHEIHLPTEHVAADRDFGGQRFVRHVAADSVWEDRGSGGCRSQSTSIAAATGGLADVRVFRLEGANECLITSEIAGQYRFLYMLDGAVDMEINGERTAIPAETALVIPPGVSVKASASAATILSVALTNI